MHPMERLRYVARAGGADPALIVAETIEALERLQPGPGELVSVCRNLVERHVTCGPLWWLGARLLGESGTIHVAWELAEEVAADPTADHLAVALTDQATVLTVGHPSLVTPALTRCGDLTVLAVEAGNATNALVRTLDRHDVSCHVVPAEAMLAAVSAADVVVIEAEACTAESAVIAVGSQLAAVAAQRSRTPVWLVAGRGRRLPEAFVTAISGVLGGQALPWEGEFDVMPVGLATRVVGPDGTGPPDRAALAPECALVPELIPVPFR